MSSSPPESKKSWVVGYIAKQPVDEQKKLKKTVTDIIEEMIGSGNHPDWCITTDHYARYLAEKYGIEYDSLNIQPLQNIEQFEEGETEE